MFLGWGIQNPPLSPLSPNFSHFGQNIRISRLFFFSGERAQERGSIVHILLFLRILKYYRSLKRKMLTLSLLSPGSALTDSAATF